MNRRAVEVIASALVCFVVGYALWPPRHVYWEALADVVGVVPTMAVVMLVTAAVGAGIAAASDVSLANLAIGAGIAYVVGMALIEVVMMPDESPVHFYLYGWLLGILLLGSVVERYAIES